MHKAEAQHSHVHNRPAQRLGRGTSLESPQGKQLAQREAMVEASTQAGKLAQLAAMAHNSPSMTAQRKAINTIHNSPQVTVQRQQLEATQNKINGPAQLKESVYIKESARRHYNDGWGAKVGVTSDEELKAKVPDDAKGNQTKQLGYEYAPLNEQTRPPESGIKKAKKVTLCTEDGKNVGETRAYHCGPSGPAIEHYTDTGKRCPWN